MRHSDYSEGFEFLSLCSRCCFNLSSSSHLTGGSLHLFFLSGVSASAVWSVGASLVSHMSLFLLWVSMLGNLGNSGTLGDAAYDITSWQFQVWYAHYELSKASLTSHQSFYGCCQLLPIKSFSCTALWDNNGTATCVESILRDLVMRRENCDLSSQCCRKVYVRRRGFFR